MLFNYLKSTLFRTLQIAKKAVYVNLDYFTKFTLKYYGDDAYNVSNHQLHIDK